MILTNFLAKMNSIIQIVIGCQQDKTWTNLRFPSLILEFVLIPSSTYQTKGSSTLIKLLLQKLYSAHLNFLG